LAIHFSTSAISVAIFSGKTSFLQPESKVLSAENERQRGFEIWKQLPNYQSRQRVGHLLSA